MNNKDIKVEDTADFKRVLTYVKKNSKEIVSILQDLLEEVCPGDCKDCNCQYICTSKE